MVLPLFLFQTVAAAAVAVIVQYFSIPPQCLCPPRIRIVSLSSIKPFSHMEKLKTLFVPFYWEIIVIFSKSWMLWVFSCPVSFCWTHVLSMVLDCWKNCSLDMLRRRQQVDSWIIWFVVDKCMEMSMLDTHLCGNALLCCVGLPASLNSLSHFIIML